MEYYIEGTNNLMWLSDQFRKTVRKTFNYLGFDIKRLTPHSNPCCQLIQSFQSFDIDVVLDVGANKGQFSSRLRKFGYQGRIVSFEPLSDAYHSLIKVAEKDPNWIVHERCAIGENDGSISINVAQNSVSSSILPILEDHLSVAPQSVYIGSEKIPIYCLDSISSIYYSSNNNLFVKIDTQGYEWQVISGALETLRNAQGILCELSLTPLYGGQHLWLEVLDYLKSEGFCLWSINESLINQNNGKTLQIDASFFKINS